MDKALDEVIASKPKQGRRPRASGPRRSGGRAQILGKPASAATPTQRAKVAQTLTKPVVASQSEKIMVSNLPFDVNEQQIKELFQSTVGPLKEVTLHFDANGRSKGIAAVQFQRKGDGNKAFAQYNNRLIDGKRPMKIEMVLDPSRAPTASLVSRVAPAPANNAPNGAAPKSAGGRNSKRGARSKKTRKVPKTAADLDAEMEDYTAAPTAAAPAAAA